MEYHEIGERFEYDGVMLEVIQTQVVSVVSSLTTGRVN